MVDGCRVKNKNRTIQWSANVPQRITIFAKLNWKGMNGFENEQEFGWWRGEGRRKENKTEKHHPIHIFICQWLVTELFMLVGSSVVQSNGIQQKISTFKFIIVVGLSALYVTVIVVDNVDCNCDHKIAWFSVIRQLFFYFIQFLRWGRGTVKGMNDAGR